MELNFLLPNGTRSGFHGFRKWWPFQNSGSVIHVLRADCRPGCSCSSTTFIIAFSWQFSSLLRSVKWFPRRLSPLLRSLFACVRCIRCFKFPRLRHGILFARQLYCLFRQLAIAFQRWIWKTLWKLVRWAIRHCGHVQVPHKGKFTYWLRARKHSFWGHTWCTNVWYLPGKEFTRNPQIWGFVTQDLHSWGFHIEISAYGCVQLQKICSSAQITKMRIFKSYVLGLLSCVLS